MDREQGLDQRYRRGNQLRNYYNRVPGDDAERPGEDTSHIYPPHRRYLRHLGSISDSSSSINARESTQASGTARHHNSEDDDVEPGWGSLCLRYPLLHLERSERQPLAWVPEFLQREGLRPLPFVALAPCVTRRVGVDSLKRPPAAAALPVQNLEGGLEPLVASEAEGCDDVQPHQDVVVVMDRIVQPEPGAVFGPALLEELSFQVELGSTLNRALDPSGQLFLW